MANAPEVHGGHVLLNSLLFGTSAYCGRYHPGTAFKLDGIRKGLSTAVCIPRSSPE